MPVEAGIKFGHYVLLRRLARGGMAEVFLAQQHGLEGFDRRVAVKRILPHLADSSEFVQMFLTEAKLAAQLSHPNIVHIYEFGKVEQDYFIAMEFVDGVHAGQLISSNDDSGPTLPRERLPPALVARLGADAAVALHHAHELRSAQGKSLGLVHRDVSPANLMISYDGVVKLCDFGIAKAAAVSDRLTNPGQVKGKYAYMSPEQTTGAALDGRSDVFSLAIVMWELLAGRFIVPRGNAIAAMRAIRDGKLEPLTEAAPGTPPPLVDAITWALANDRGERATAAELAQALEAYIKSSPELATPMQLAAWVRRWFPREATGDESLSTPVGTAAASRAQAAVAPHEITPERLIGASRIAAEEISGPESGTSIYVKSGDFIRDGDTFNGKATTGGATVVDANGPDAPTVLVAPHPVDDEDERDTLESGSLDLPLDDVAPTPPSRPSPTVIATHASGPRLAPSAPRVAPSAPRVMPQVQAAELAGRPSASPAAMANAAADRQRRLRIAGAIGALVGLALISFAIALAAKSRRTPATASDAGTAGSAGSAAIAATPANGSATPANGSATPANGSAMPAAHTDAGIAAAVAPPTDAGIARTVPPADAAAPPPTPPIDAAVSEVELDNDAAPPHRGHRLGRLNVRTSPHAEVFENGKKLGDTPMTDRELPAGTHVLTFKNPLHPTVTKTVVITAGKVAKLDFDLP